MKRNLTETQEIGLLKYLAELTSLGDLDELLDLIVRKTPALLGVRRCSIYLNPEFVHTYKGDLVDSDLSKISRRDIKEDVIILAQTNDDKKRKYLGKIFYRSGEDLTGWVFQTGKTLICRNARDPEELASIHPSLRLSLRYHELDPDGESVSDPVAILYIPLKTTSQVIGVLKLHRPLDSKEFTDKDEGFAIIIAQVIAVTAQKIHTMSHQQKQIFELSELGAEKNPSEVIKRVTKRVSELLDCPKVEFYLRAEDGEYMRLEFVNGERIEGEKVVQYRKREGFIGWVHRTRTSVFVADLKEYLEERFLDDTILASISDSMEVNEKDRLFVPLNQDFISSMDRKIPFMAAPVVGADGSVQGVICAHFLTRRHVRRQKPFDLIELQLLKTFASTISLALQFELSRKRGLLLLDLNRLEELPRLFEMVVMNIPTLIHGTDCFIYMKEKNGQGLDLQLKASNRGVMDIAYKIGEGKTGLAALAGMTLVIDHFGAGNISRIKIEAHREKLHSSLSEDLLGNLVDEDNDSVGIIRLRDGAQANLRIKWLFRELCKDQVIQHDRGLPSVNMNKYFAMGSQPSFSFAAVPIGSDDDELAGVITVARPSDENPFSFEDIDFIESIAKTLGHVISTLTMQERRKELFVNLAHEVNTYLTPLLADSENIRDESNPDSDLRYMGEHLLGQVHRLQIMTETILGVFSSGESIVSEMENRSVYRPLADAIDMFRDEASLKGCDILDPAANGYPRFPEIEMNLFELTLAFKNIIHNAIKYSYQPPRGLDRHRFIRTVGEWYDMEKQYYCINIQNYGVGISTEEITNRTIFRPFHRGIFSTDRNRTGSGVGLAFVEKIVKERHHGEILVVSLPQDGGAHLTTFRVILPVRQPGLKKGSIS